jgi:hypothetical protein
VFASVAAVLAGRTAVTALATHHVITTAVAACVFAVTATTSHVITAGLAVGAAALAAGAARVAAVGAAGSTARGATAFAFSLAGGAAALASTTDCRHVRLRGVGCGVHLYIKCKEINTAQQ